MKFIATITSAVLLAYAVPNEFALFGHAGTAFLCLAPYFAALGMTKSYRGAALLGFFFGVVSHAVSSYWLYFFKDFALWTLGSTSLAYGFLHMLVAAFLRWGTQAPQIERILWPLETIPLGNWPLAVKPVHHRSNTSFSHFSLLRPFVLAALWTLWEWGKSNGFLGYPWGLVAYGLNNYPLMIQIVDSLGVYGLSFFLAFSSALMVELLPLLPLIKVPRDFPAYRLVSQENKKFEILNRSEGTLGQKLWWRPVLMFVVLFLWFAGYGTYRLSRPTPVVDELPLLLVQHNADSWVGGELPALRTAIRLSREGLATFKESTGLEKPSLIVWSETVLRRPFEDYRPFFRNNPRQDPLIPFLEETQLPLLTGAPVVLNWETFDATNSVIYINPDASVSYSYAKRHPVPFAEAIPFWEYQWMRDLMANLVGIDGSWTMGTEAVVMEVPNQEGRLIRFGTPICFEDAFPSVCRDFFAEGADLLINLTNDSWSRTVSSELQHLVAARFRTIENRRVLVRSTNGGITSVIDAEGKIIQSIPPFTESYLAVRVPIQKQAAPTVYYLLGDWFTALLGFFVLIWMMIGIRVVRTGQAERP
ncbi:MAG: apolipoprotein N-acyltransferase [Termitinemataceae bacterium]